MALPIDQLTDDPPQYVINLYTWLSDLDAAADLARKIAEHVRSFQYIDRFATTVSLEGDPAAEPRRVYADLTRPRNDDSAQQPAGSPAKLHLVS